MLIHSEEKPYMCDICERAFNVVSNLRRHLRTVHKETLAPSLELSAPRIRVWILSTSPLSEIRNVASQSRETRIILKF